MRYISYGREQMDTLSPNERSERMARVRCKDTKPEISVRRLVHVLGYRFRLHANRVPGRPDLVFPSRRKIIFVHGCSWHRHKGCRKPVSSSEPRFELQFCGPPGVKA